MPQAGAREQTKRAQRTALPRGDRARADTARWVDEGPACSVGRSLATAERLAAEARTQLEGGSHPGLTRNPTAGEAPEDRYPARP
jgi:hypothetical protein